MGFPRWARVSDAPRPYVFSSSRLAASLLVSVLLLAGFAISAGGGVNGEPPAVPSARVGSVSGVSATDGVPIRELPEFFVSPVSGASYRIHKDAGHGTYEFCGMDGRCFSSREEILTLEAKGLPEWALTVEPALRSRIAEAGPLSNADALVIVELRDATFAGVASTAWARTDPELRRLEGLAAALPDGSAKDAPVLAQINSLVDSRRRGIYTESEASLAPLISRVQGRIEALGGTYGGYTPVLPAVFALIPFVSIPRLAESPWVARITEDRPVPVLMDVSAYAIHADTWWTNGYTGGPWDLAVEDTGIDSTHPAFAPVTIQANVFHAAGQSDSCYADQPTNPDDLHSHGTHVAGTVASNDNVYRGIAYGLRTLINAKAGWLVKISCGGGGAMYPTDGMLGVDWAVKTAGADVVSLSFGGGTGVSDTPWERFFDAVVDGLGVSVAIAAGNSGPGARTVGEPGAAFNILSVGAVDDRNTRPRTDDQLAGFSSRGPTGDGRLKPDIAAPGVQITSTYAFWEGPGQDFIAYDGTSMATPHVAASYILLMNGIGSRFPPWYKALLLNSAEDRTPAGPDTGFGWGYIDLAAAYAGRNNVREGNVTDGAVHYVFYRGSALTGDRATLVWNRHATYIGGTYPIVYQSTANDLDLLAYDEADGSRVAASTRTVDNVEQVVAPFNVPTIIYKVNVPGALTSVTQEHYAIAFPSNMIPISPPTLSVALAGPATAELGSPFTVWGNVTDSGGVAAQAVAVTLNLPAGLTLLSGANPQTIAGISPGTTRTVTWQVRGNTLGLQMATASARSVSYEETFTASSGPYSVIITDSVLPTSSVNPMPASTTTPTFSVTASANDAGGVAKVELFYRKDAGSDTSYGNDTAAPWQWTFDTTTTGGDGFYEFYSVATDRASNVEAPPPNADASTTVDSAPPVSTADSLPTFEATPVFTVTATATDPGSGVASVDLYYRRAGGAWALLGTDSAAPWSWTFDSGPAGGDGAYEFYSVATDGIGNREATPPAMDASTTVDTAPPTTSRTLSGTPGRAPWYVSAVSVRLTASDPGSGLATTAFRIDGGSWQTYSVPFLVSGDRIHTVEYASTDNAGNVEPTQIVEISIDTTPPTTAATLGGTLGGSGWYRSNVSILLVASDETSGNDTTEFQLDGGGWQTYIDGVTVLTEGLHGIAFRSTDKAGNTEADRLLAFKMDLTPPKSDDSFTGTQGLQGWYTSSVSVTLRATDGLSGIAGIEYRESTASAWAAYGAGFSVDTDGSHAIDLRATDVAGNIETAHGFEFKVDTTPPWIRITEPTPATTSHAASMVLRWSPSDNTSGLAGCSVALDGGTPIPVAGSTSYTFEGIGNGAHGGTVTCTDAAGNIGTSSVEFSVDTSALGALGPAVWVLLGLLAAVFAILIVFLMKRRKKEEEASVSPTTVPQEGPPPPPEEPGPELRTPPPPPDDMPPPPPT